MQSKHLVNDPIVSPMLRVAQHRDSELLYCKTNGIGVDEPNLSLDS